MKNTFKSMKAKNIWVIGDVLLDIYIQGDTSRVSPEAPVPVVNFRSKEYFLGGAGNVANNLKSLGANVSLIGRIGKDSYGLKVEKLCFDLGINISNLFSEKNLRTITKKRIISNGQQIVRIDNEDTDEISKLNQLNILDQIIKNKEDIGFILLSDYNKGVLSKDFIRDIIKVCNESNIRVIADPKKEKYTCFEGVYLLTPNQKEAEIASGVTIKNDETLHECFVELNKQTKSTIQLITRSEKGISLYDHGTITTYPVIQKEVYDVTGAGDTVIAALTHFLNLGYSIQKAIKYSIAAASIVISKIGVVSVTMEEIIRELSHREFTSKMIKSSSKELDHILSLHKEEKIVFTNGCFDILHKGHIRYLDAASKLGDILIVGLNSDQSVRRLKGQSRPIQDETTRGEILKNLRSVDYVILFDEDTPIELISRIKPFILAKGGDYKVDEVVGKEFAKKVIILPFEKGYSTTSIINKINKINNE